MTVLEDSVRVGTRLSGLVDIACAVHRPDIPAMLVEWLGRRPDGHCIVDCTDDFQVVYATDTGGLVITTYDGTNVTNIDQPTVSGTILGVDVVADGPTQPGYAIAYVIVDVNAVARFARWMSRRIRRRAVTSLSLTVPVGTSVSSAISSTV